MRFALCLLICSPLAASADSHAFPESKREWHGFPAHELTVKGRTVTVVAPISIAAGRPWVWHGEFFGHKPAPDIALLREGFHIVYVRVPDMLGSPEAVRIWGACYEVLTSRHGLAKRPALVGLSRGGLYCYNWAIANPERVACIYGDAPVCDFKSWPGGFGDGKGSPRDWKLVLERYGFKDDEEAQAYDGNPVDRLEPLAKAGVPLLHVYGDADAVVPWEENTGLLAKRYRDLGGSIDLIQKPGVGHHPHGLNDPTPIVEFIRTHASVEKPTPRKPRDPVDRLAVTQEPNRKVVYKTVDDRELYLHVFEPDGRTRRDRRSAFVIFHGGGWVNGEPRRMYPFAKHFADCGMVGISVQYRLHSKRTGVSVFDCVRDARSALRFVRSHAADLGIDPEQIVVSGGSAGGHLALATDLFDAVNDPNDDLTVSPDPNALVLLFPVIDTSADGYGQQKIGERWRELSPAHNVQPTTAPTLIFHGTGDRVTPYAGVTKFREAMETHDRRCDVVAHTGGAHGYLMRDVRLLRKTLATTERFLISLGMLDAKQEASAE